MPKAGSGLSLDGLGMPLWLVIELTYKCPLKCPWCSNPVDFDRYRNELSTEEWIDVLREGRRLGSLQLGFTGGEPMLRKDLEVLVGEADRLGYYTNLITSGVGLSPERLRALKKAGLKQIQLSLQACDQELNEKLVGLDVFRHKIEIARTIKAEGFPMVMNVPVSRFNIDQTEAFIDLAADLGVEYLEFANLQYYNWALINRAELIPTREQLARSEAQVNAARERLGKKLTIYFVVPDYYDNRPKACMNGWGAIHLTIAPDGTALPCQEARLIKGIDFPNVRDHGLDFIWRKSQAFNAFRGDEWMKEPCRSCSEKEKDFGGCRCQAFLLTGDAANTDPVCTKSPHRHLIDNLLAEVRPRPDEPATPLIMREAGRSKRTEVG
ncbi:pyrroloquinoline quinone biosynthesis protein PqqE [Hyphomicrobium sp.]|uniref:pyrroloquinoline quinone biosynthesis protein PqqE n=1 Tax=Hyphomicrobium sp. TaxID=82 RepID=UPI002C274152|nr:pyrroloquinoline quinone biosynthesis protein PqqE [Hyphomicrobium sp.]HRN87947.1 pyrroloquinoline quinone biosynthesis protein PqqE [Hyphomicrobium sp.]HRQ26229.1 pyrroloquinoline quinone biosynthesis protein PqqE [Hyphomicrobium sp.]